jgi:hypothetical protein
MPYTRLHEGDPVVQSLKLIKERRLLASFTKPRVLANGKLEKQLKLFLATAWIRRGRNRACVMDKRCNRRELDLLALQNAEPRYWVETKCDFRESPREAKKSARDALRKVKEINNAIRGKWTGELSWAERFVRKTARVEKWHRDATRLKGETKKEKADILEFRRKLRNRPSYIVHFITSVPRNDDSQHPKFILGKFPRQDPITLDQLRAAYTGRTRRTLVQVRTVRHITGKSHQPPVDALILKFPC